MNWLTSFLRVITCAFMPLCGKGPQVGDQAPELGLHDELGILRKLSDYKDKTIVLYFYPKDDTPGCTKQACTLGQRYTEFEKLGAIVLGVSYDSLVSHRKFKKKYNLPFTLLSDSQKKLTKAYGVKSWLWLMPKRSTFVIKNGKIIWRRDNVDVTTHTNEVLQAIQHVA